MASSSRTEKPRTSGSQSKQGGSSSKSNSLNLTRLLSNDEEPKVFEEHFNGRTIFTPNTGKDIISDIKTFSSLCCDIPMQGSTMGFDLVCEWDNYDRKRFYLSLCRISKEEIEQRKQQGYGKNVKNIDILSAGYLKLEERLLHYFLSYVILPKFSNHSQIGDIKL
ncbi:hypothetical protein Lal_00033716 [Lupinus albus]|nr:hypothetical protein Lal_00033716 [Lupinus albus]